MYSLCGNEVIHKRESVISATLVTVLSTVRCCHHLSSDKCAYNLTGTAFHPGLFAILTLNGFVNQPCAWPSLPPVSLATSSASSSGFNLMVMCGRLVKKRPNAIVSNAGSDNAIKQAHPLCAIVPRACFHCDKKEPYHGHFESRLFFHPFALSHQDGAEQAMSAQIIIQARNVNQ